MATAIQKMTADINNEKQVYDQKKKRKKKKKEGNNYDVQNDNRDDKPQQKK